MIDRWPEPNRCKSNRQKIIKIDTVVRRPRQMLGEDRRLGPVEQAAQAQQVILVKRGFAAKRKGHAVNGERPGCRNPVKQDEVRTASTHEILGMDLNKIDWRRIGQERLAMLALQTDPHAMGQSGQPG